MSRTRKAALVAAFTYVQFALAIVSGVVLIPLILHNLGARTYGLWLTTGELLAYAGMIDLGVLGVLPWMLAEADGRHDRDAMRSLVSNGLCVGLVVGAAYLIVAAVLWTVLPSALHLTPNDRAMVGPPVALIVVATALDYPVRVFRAVLAGLQDVVFNGLLGIAQSVLNVLVTIVLLIRGHGIYALAWAVAGSTALAAIAGVVRAACIAPDLLSHWKRPTLTEVGRLLGQGFGVWTAAFGWQMIAASNSLAIAYVGRLEWVPIYNCTAKLSALCMRLGWVLPDSGLIGLAQLAGERRGSARLTQMVGAMLRLHLLMSGAAACAVLAFNPAFVARWVGEPFFGGLSLNALLAAGIILYSMAHGVMTAASVLGNRLQVGVVALVNGGLQLVCAVWFGHRFGLAGIAVAGLLAGAVTAVPAGIYLLRAETGLTFRIVATELIAPWLLRVAPLVATAAVTGLFYRSLGVWMAGGVAVLIGVVYLWQMRPLYGVLPLDPRWVRWLALLKLMPPVPASAAVVEQ